MLLLRERLHDHPALVERAAGNAEPPIPQVGQSMDGCAASPDQSAEGSGKREKRPIGTGHTLARDPQPVRH
ncbi:MAG: hypothetical protein ACRET2_08395, partial [Steroidobacteraceae bacterium]